MIVIALIVLLSFLIVGILPFLNYINRLRLNRLNQINRSMDCRIRAVRRYDSLIGRYYKQGYEMTVNYCLTRISKLLTDLVSLENEWKRIRLNCDLYYTEIGKNRE